ncbi:tyrosine-type recombinase/integrase [Aestuariivirga sp.]|jgi:integrase|uniref:tyrosine-type recombinase/integrase n=1 Tax=Aestuariivirga sp. TaxID=2650926 RepID=UPI0037846D65
MAGKLNARKVETLTKPGRYSDEGTPNLYLRITPNGGKRWTFFYRFGGQRKDMGLGSAGPGGVSLAEARQKADAARAILRTGTDPMRVMGKDAREKSDRTVPTFGAFADDYIKSHKPKFRNAKHIAQWEMTLGDAYCRSIRGRPISGIDTAAILSVLQPIWTEVPETASRLRGRIENVLDAARAMGFREGPNPATWRGHLKTLLPARQKLTRGHHAALAYDSLPAFMADLRARQSTAALAMELCILTASRSSEVLNAEWSEFDLDKAVWTIPAKRMKAGQAHRIPLPDRALDILRSLRMLDGNPHVFPGNARGKPLSGMAMTMQLRRMKRDNITVHGFRSTFRDWASEQTSFPHETCEHALAHRISDKAEAAYRRGDQFEKRRKLMEAWAAFCEPASNGNVVTLRSAGT